MREVLLILNIIVSVVVVALILIQGRGAGLGNAFGGGGETYQTRRGVELLTMRLTVFFIIVFFVVSAVNFFL